MEIICQLAGANFRTAEAKEIIYALEVGDTLTLERDPENAYDSNAIKVLKDDVFIGFVPKDDNSLLAKAMDAGEKFACEVIDASLGLKPMLLVYRAEEDESYFDQTE